MKKRKLEKGEIGFLAALGVFSLICLIGSIMIFVGSPTLSGEGIIPLVISAIMMIMTVLMLAEIRNCPKGFEKSTVPGQKLRETVAHIFPGKMGLMLLYCILYAVLVGWVGFTVSTLVFLVGSMLTLKKENPIKVVLISGITLGCIIVLFQYIFKVQLP